MNRALRVVFAGTPEFAVPGLTALLDSGYTVPLVLTQPDRPAGRGRQLRASPVKALADARGITVYQPESLRHESALEPLRAERPDLVVVAAYGLILPLDMLNLPPLGCINIHASLLPRWRGAAPIQHAILSGDRETGVTIMQMDEGLDTGGILLQESCPITPRDTAASLHDRLAQLGARTLLDALPGVQNRSIMVTAQDPTRVTYAGKLSKQSAAIDWQLPAELLARQVRAFNPWPVAYAKLGQDNLRIWDAEALQAPADLPPGAVIASGTEGVDVATGSGILRLHRLQLPGKRPVTAAEFANARPLQDTRLQ